MPVISWAALNIGGDVGRDPTVWANQQRIYKAAGLPFGPWLHCRNLGDIDFLIDVGQSWGSPFIGLNIEDVQGDFVDHGISLQDIAQKVAGWPGPIHMATLPWVQNGQGWKVMSRCVAALEIFPDENLESNDPQACLKHAFEEGLTQVTFMFKTAGHAKEDYGSAFSICHSLYTADDITPIAPAWAAWELHGQCVRPTPPTQPIPPVTSVPFTRVIDKGDIGTDCEGIGRALCRAGAGIKIATFNAQPLKLRRTFGDRKVAWLKKFQKSMPHKPTGVYDKATHLALSPHFDAKAINLMEAWKPLPPPLIEPKQGFSSLVDTLWEDYSMGRRIGLTDLGTYNPKSTLPSSGAPSDHASHDGVHIAPPARAFDLGFSPQTGQSNPLAKSFFNAMVGRPEVEYVILGDKIWSQDSDLHAYTFGGHDGHVHTSGRH